MNIIAINIIYYLNILIMDFITNRIDIKVFLLSLAIGLLIVYLTAPTPEIVFQHPTPQNLDTVYKEKDRCYKYDANETTCSRDTKKTPGKKTNIFEALTKNI
tara:strand:+ start:190 stop:495 length:306 start_codon:yes stop_codon:yes gene_type:complete